MKNILGIDLGTSSVKMIYHDGEKTYKVKEKYEEIKKSVEENNGKEKTLYFNL